ncbi:MAG: hypothetical protein D8M58_00945 [Calditrichaeota bacterium]|nr:MAG: hypothetical protein DWQ03_06135 [Calditrichota bacterium]MBL1203934.1 hypothetical protein [Calditrichota bacterium]NOG43767.1 hypothetical protein [Calditrichota bacterium]
MNIFKKIFSTLAVILIIFISLKSCVKVAYGTKNFSIYERTEISQIEILILTPSNKMILIKKHPEFEAFDAGLYQIYGTQATHLVSGLWNIDGVINPFGFRWYNDNVESVWQFYLKLENKSGYGIEESSFGDKGEEYDVPGIIYNDKISIGGIEYFLTEYSQEDLNVFLKLFDINADPQRSE